MGGNSIYTRVFFHNTRKEGTVFFRELNYDSYPLEPIPRDEVESNIIALRFFCGQHGKEIYKFYRANGWDGEAVLLKSTVGKVKAERKPKPKGKTVILWAPSYPAAGFCPYNAWYEQNEKIIEGLSKIAGIELLVKFHINQDDYSVNILKEKFGNGKALFINKKEAIEQYIKKADIVLTNPSTVIYDAMLMNRITIAVTDGCRVRLKDEVLFIACDELEKSIEYVAELMDDEKAWEERLDIQSDFVGSFLDFETEDVNAMITETLVRKISE